MVTRQTLQGRRVGAIADHRCRACRAEAGLNRVTWPGAHFRLRRHMGTILDLSSTRASKIFASHSQLLARYSTETVQTLLRYIPLHGVDRQSGGKPPIYERPCQ